MNYITLIGKIVQNPEQSFFENGESITETLIEFTPINSNKVIEYCKISLWGDFEQELVRNYNLNDFIIVEGYLSYADDYDSIISKQNFNSFEIIATKIHSIFPSFAS